MRLSESHARVEIQGIVGLAGRLRDRERRRVGEHVAAADHEGIKGVLRVEVGGAHGLREAGLLAELLAVLLCGLGLLGRDQMDHEVQAGHLRDGDFDAVGILFVDDVDAHGPHGNDEGDGIMIG